MRALEFALATVIPDSSTAEQSTVNRQVLGSNPSQGALISKGRPLPSPTWEQFKAFFEPPQILGGLNQTLCELCDCG